MAERVTQPLGAWCGGIGPAIAARLGHRQEAMELARMTEDASFSLGSWESGLIQVDHAPGMARALNDILLLTLGGVMHVFPGAPAELSAAFHSLRTEGAFLVSSEKRGREVMYVLITSLAGEQLRVPAPFGNGQPVAIRLRDLDTGEVVHERRCGRILDSEAARVELASEASSTWIFESETGAGRTYVLERTDRPLESIPMAYS